MALIIHNAEVERLATELAKLTGKSKTEAIRKALEERQARLSQRVRRTRRERWLNSLEHEGWPTIPEGQLGRSLSKEEEDEILGYERG